MLFRAKKLVAPKTLVEMIFRLLIGGSVACGAKGRRLGQIVPKAQPVGLGGEAGLAASIEEYHLMRTEEVSHA